MDDTGLPQLRERDAVLAAAAALVDRVRTGAGGGSLFIVGQAGLGKTALLEHVRRQGVDGISVGLGQGDPMETSIPYALLAQAVGAIGGEEVLTGRLPDLPPQDDARATRFYAILRWLQELPAPALLLLDDLHWADPDSLALVSFLSRRIADRPVALVGTMRSWPVAASNLAFSLAHVGRAAVFRLQPLSTGAAGELLAERLQRPEPPEALERITALCAGNPLLLEQAALAINRGEDVVAAAPYRFIDRYLLLGRFAGLPPDGLRWAQAASVLGTRFRPEFVARIGEFDDDPSAAEALWRSGLIRDSAGGQAEFVHPLLREAVYDDLPPPVRTSLHRNAFDVLVAHGLEPEAAEHALAASPAALPRAAAVLERVGREALRAGIPNAAARYLQGAAEAAGSRADAALLRDLSRALMAVGRPLSALGAIERVVAEPDTLPPSERAESFWRYGQAAALSGRLADAENHLAEAATLADPECRLAITVRANRALVVALHRGPRHALHLADQVLSQALPHDEDLYGQAEAVRAFIGVAANIPGSTGRRGWEPEVGPLRHRDDNPPEIAMLCGVAAVWLERFGDADVIFRSLQPDPPGATAPPFLAGASGRLLLLARTGRFEHGLALVREVAAARDRVPVAETWFRLLESYLLLETGQSTAAAAAWDQAAAGASDCFSRAFLDHLDGLRLLRHGEVTAASDRYLRLERLADDAGIGEPCSVPWARHGIAAHLGAGRLADALRLTERLEQAADRLPCRWPRAAAGFGRAGLAMAAANYSEAVVLYRTALNDLDPVDLPAERVELLIAYAAALRRAGQTSDARAALRRALETAERCGAAPLAELAGRELRLVGGRRRRNSDRGRLTAAEERVAALLAEGAPNREIARRLFVSEATVKTHIEHIFAKLEIHSRRELIARSNTGDRTGDDVLC